ncbi:unnamed protein product, partial [Urochloa humidicola]
AESLFLFLSRSLRSHSLSSPPPELWEPALAVEDEDGLADEEDAAALAAATSAHKPLAPRHQGEADRGR